MTLEVTRRAGFLRLLHCEELVRLFPFDGNAGLALS